jgi:hypothetical protein
VSDIDTAAADSLKVLDPERPIREADMLCPANIGSFGPVSTASASKALILLSSLTSRISSSCAGRWGFSFAEEPPDYPAIEPDTRELENILSHRSLWLSFLNVEWRLLAISLHGDRH